MREAVLLFCACIITGAIATIPFATERDNRKQVDAVCVRQDDDGTMILYFGATFNGNDVDKILALPEPDFDRLADGTTNAVPCSYEGNLDESIQITSTVSITGASGTNTCGAQRVSQGFGSSQTLIGYEWYIQIREKYNLEIYTDIDRTYHVRCLFDDVMSNYVTTNVQVYKLQDSTGNSQTIRPISMMSVLTDNGESVVRLNSLVLLQVQTEQQSNRENALHHYGSFVYFCHYKESLNGQPRRYIDDDGCPTPGSAFGMTEGYKAFDYVTDRFGIRSFRTRTPRFVMARGRPVGSHFYLDCYVGYCKGAEGTDNRCTDYCQSNGGRKKRSTFVDADADRVTLAIRVYGEDEDVTGTEKAVGDEEVSTTLIVVIAIVGLLFIVMVSVAVCFVCFLCRRRRDVTDETSSTEGSTNTLPRHLTKEHLGPVKI